MNGRVWIYADYSQAEARVVAWAGPVPALKTWFQKGEDVHLNVAKMIGRIVQEHKIQMPRSLWSTKPWQELTRKDPERQLAKNTVHGNNYDMGKVKFALITGLPVKYAAIVQEIYHATFPEIRSGYHKWINDELTKTRTLYNPLGWKRTFYQRYGPELSRAAYAWYPQSTIGLLTIRTLRKCCEVFDTESVPLWKAPWEIRRRGLDVQLQVHDSIGVSVPDDPAAIEYACSIIKTKGEYPLTIKGDTLTIPIDFKVGPNWGELHEYIPKTD